MAESSQITDARARKTHSVLLQAVATVGLTPVAEACGIDKSTVARMRDNEFERIAMALTAMGLKPVPIDSTCYRPEYIQHLRYFARRGFDTEQQADEDAE